MTHDQTIWLLANHGVSPEVGVVPHCTATTCSRWDPATSFYAEFGIRSQYSLAAVREWLGY